MKHSDTTQAARAGHAAPDAKPPHLHSSAMWLCYRAGQELAKTGRTAPDLARPSRGYSVKMESNSGFAYLARFSKDLGQCAIERTE